MMTNSINTTTFKLVKAGTTTAIGAVVSYGPTTKEATLNPTNNLRLGTKYKSVVTTGAKDLAGTPSTKTLPPAAPDRNNGSSPYAGRERRTKGTLTRGAIGDRSNEEGRSSTQSSTQ
jgi:Big-like domain-containing protein